MCNIDVISQFFLHDLVDHIHAICICEKWNGKNFDRRTYRNHVDIMLKILPRKKSSQRISSDQNHQEVSILPNYNYDNNLEDNINQFSTNLHNDNYDDTYGLFII